MLPGGMLQVLFLDSQGLRFLFVTISVFTCTFIFTSTFICIFFSVDDRYIGFLVYGVCRAYRVYVYGV